MTRIKILTTGQTGASRAASATSVTRAGNIGATDVQAALEELDAEKQPLDSDLTAIAALSTQSFGRSLLTQASASAARTTLGVDYTTIAADTALTSRFAQLTQWQSITARSAAQQARLSTAVTHVSGTSRLRFPITHAATDIRLIYTNWTGKEDLANADSITVAASVEIAGATSGYEYVPVYFNGSPTVVIPPGGRVISDPIGVYLPVGNTFVRTYVQVASGDQWTNNYYAAAGYGEGNEYGASGTNKTMTGTVTTANALSYGPAAILGRAVSPHTVVGIVGDSISTADEVTTWDSALSWIRTGLTTSRAILMVANTGEAVETTYTNASSFSRRCAMLREAGVTTVVVMYATNDYIANRTATQIQTWLQALYDRLNAAGFRVIGVTTPPYTTSSDSWATVNNQTAAGTSGTHRPTVNDWIRTTPSPLYTYFEVADTVESARNSNKWKASYTADGIHPNTTAITQMATAVDLTKLL